MEAREARLGDLEDRLGLPPFRLPPGLRDEAVRLLELGPDARRRLTPDGCADAALALAQYAVYVHRLAQRARARAAWCEEEVARLTAPLLGQYDQYLPAPDRRRLAVRECEPARAVEAVRLDSASLAERVAYLAQRVREVAEEYRNLSFTRRHESV